MLGVTGSDSRRRRRHSSTRWAACTTTPTTRNRGALHSGRPFAGRPPAPGGARRERRYNSNHQRSPADATRTRRVRSRCVKNTSSSTVARTATPLGSVFEDVRSCSDGGLVRRRTFACCRTTSRANFRVRRARLRRCGSWSSCERCGPRARIARNVELGNTSGESSNSAPSYDCFSPRTTGARELHRVRRGHAALCC